MSLPVGGPGENTPTAEPWHAVDEHEVALRLSSPDEGLTEGEAAERLRKYGENALPEPDPPGPLQIFARQFISPLIYILVAAAGVTALLQEWIDTGIILAVVLLNAIIGLVQESGAERAVRSLSALLSPRASVIRGGQLVHIESRLLVPGDRVLLESGVRVPADIRLLTATNLLIDEAILTGESAAASKHTGTAPAEALPAERFNMAHAGTVVRSGRAMGVVVATGAATAVGQIAETMRREQTPQTPLQDRLASLARTIGVAVAAASLLSFGIGTLQGNPGAEMLKVAVALAVSATPEGLPVAFTITLAVGVRRMANRKAIIRHLPAVETLGSTTVVGSDKTGTLTQNEMTVMEVWTAAGTHLPGKEPVHPGSPLERTLIAGIVANEASLVREGDDWVPEGDPTETALLVAAEAFGVEHERVRAIFAPVFDVPFEPELRYSGTVRESAGTHLFFVKGAPERILEMCADIEHGPHREPIDRVAIQQATDAAAARGLRVLAMAYGEIAPGEEPPREPAGLTYLGFQAMMDPPREGVLEAVRGCQQAGIRVVMITGDHASTALAIARQLGIAGPDDVAVEGRDIEEMTSDELQARMRTATVCARMSPDHKLRVVQALQREGHVVAVTGDGVNDAPALRAADLGVAMGLSGTDVAREAADMVLADDNFVSIYAAVREGRVTFDNIRNVTFFLISTGAAEIAFILTALILDWDIPLLAAQILWLNLVTNGIQHVALAFEPGDRNVLKRPPRPRGEGILSRLLWERVLLTAVVMGGGILLLFKWEMDAGQSLDYARSVALTGLVAFEVFQVGNSRSEYVSAFRKSLFSNRFLLIATVAAVSVHVIALCLPATQYILRVEPIGLESWLRIVLVASSIFVAIELHKLLRRGGPRSRGAHPASAGGLASGR
jgi:Ca2+-transporting ATPase